MLTLLFVGCAVWAWAQRLRTYLWFFQQEEYDNRRFPAWWWGVHAWDRWLSLGLVVALGAEAVQPGAGLLAGAIWAVWRGRQEPNPLITGKKPLVPTQRAQKLWWLAALLGLSGWLALATLPGWAALLVAVVLLQITPLWLLLANLLLWPLQQWQNQRFLREAQTILTRLAPKVVSISGSFGKTGTKYVLAHLLQAHAPTLMSPGSVNTPLGLARVLREQLQPQHAFFVAEMGAYNVGSIAGICRLVPPDAAAVISLGAAHFERFKTMEQVAIAELDELAQATIARRGPVVLNVDSMPTTLWQPRVAANPAAYVLVSAHPAHLRGPQDAHLTEVHETPEGLRLGFVWGGQTVLAQTQLYGTAQAGNVVSAFVLARLLGVPHATAVAALRTAPAAPHRLNKRQEGSLTVLDDSYNANPAGFAAGLATLSLLAKGQGDENGTSPARRRILVTPGLVELGTLHDAEHARLGALAAEHADVALVVNPTRIPTFVAAFRAAMAPAQALHLLPSLNAAKAWLQANAQAGDVVLLANDLPDLYEARWQL